MHIEIYPQEKVMIDRISVSLGMERTAVEAVLGIGRRFGQRYYYFRDEMAIDYSGDGKVEFIEFLGGIDGALQPVIYGISAFDIPADALTELLKQKNGGMIDASEGAYCHTFYNISVGIYRGTTPADVRALIEEMKENGTFIDDYETVEEERRRANHWATIGFGAAGYYG